MKLFIVIGSTRPGRLTERVAKWVEKEAGNLPHTQTEMIDLKDYPMPFMNEPASPRYNPQRKLDEVTKNWVAKMSEADAYIFVTPEYNHSIPGVLKNAIDYLTWELVKKPATVVSHGTVGGARAAMHLKEILSESRAAVIPSQIALPKAGESLDENGEPNDELKQQPYGQQTNLKNMLEELKWYSDALAPARAAINQ